MHFMKHPVSGKTAVSQSTHKRSYFSSYKKSKNKIKITLKSTEIMAKTDGGSSEAAVSKKHHGSKQQGNKDKQKPPTKIIIRHLPPTMTEEEFLQQIDPLPPHDFYYFASADWSLGFDATCRAYITLKNYDDVFLFRDRFDGYVFVDAKGNEYAAIVEFAPFQGIVKNKSRRTDNKVNTIEEEAHYQQFLVKLEEEREIASKGGETKMEFNLNTKKEEITSTPLLQYLANKKEKRRLEAKKRVEEKRKQRDEEKEKRRQTAQEKNKDAQVVIMSGNSAADKTQEGESKKEQKTASETEEKQSIRNKRRQERNQKRQEAFLQRKLQDKAAKSTESGEVSAAADNHNKDKENTEREKKEVKRERDRERDRERNRMRRERREKAKAENKNERRNSGNERKLCDTAKVTNKVEPKANEEAAVSKPNSLERSDSKVEEEARKQRAAEEKRIRNKDRPSIAIYQPKARLRQSEESDAGGNNSAGEKVNDTKKEETKQVKKVSRYSERRKHSAAKEKRKSSVTDEETATPVAVELKDNEADQK